jgi:hypothetical protein
MINFDEKKSSLLSLSPSPLTSTCVHSIPKGLHFYPEASTFVIPFLLSILIQSSSTDRNRQILRLRRNNEEDLNSKVVMKPFEFIGYRVISFEGNETGFMKLLMEGGKISVKDNDMNDWYKKDMDMLNSTGNKISSPCFFSSGPIFIHFSFRLKLKSPIKNEKLVNFILCGEITRVDDTFKLSLVISNFTRKTIMCLIPHTEKKNQKKDES